MATAARALSESLDHKDPLSITGHYLSRVEPGKALLEIEKLNIGKSVSTALLKFTQEGEERIRFTSCFTDFSKSKGDTLREVEAPDFPPIEECVAMPYKEGFTPVLEKQIDEARKCHYQLMKSVDLFYVDGNPPGVKEALCALKICKSNQVRLPLVKMKSKNAKMLTALLKSSEK